MSAAETGGHVFDLVCPRCGSELAGLEFDVLFCCASCGIMVDPRARATRTIELIRASLPPGHPILWLPLWRIPASLKPPPDGGPGGAAAAAARRVADRVRHVYVAAFALSREEYFGEPGLVWTRRQDAFDTIPCRDRTVIGLRRDEDTARRYVQPYLEQLVDEQHDITGLSLDATVDGNSTVLAVPFLDLGTHIADPLTGLKYPESALEDLEGIRVQASGARYP